jgi:hypothetical protein
MRVDLFCVEGGRPAAVSHGPWAPSARDHCDVRLDEAGERGPSAGTDRSREDDRDRSRDLRRRPGGRRAGRRGRTSVSPGQYPSYPGRSLGVRRNGDPRRAGGGGGRPERHAWSPGRRAGWRGQRRMSRGRAWAPRRRPPPSHGSTPAGSRTAPAVLRDPRRRPGDGRARSWKERGSSLGAPRPSARAHVEPSSLVAVRARSRAT